MEGKRIMETKMDFVNESTGRCFWMMFLPVMAAMFLNMAYNVVDSLWIGNLLGERAYAALTSSTPVILILNSIAMGATNGVAILVSQAIGAKDCKKTDGIIATSLIVAGYFLIIGAGYVLNTVTNCFLGALNEPYRGMCSGILCGIQRNMQINYVLNPKGCAIWPFVL